MTGRTSQNRARRNHPGEGRGWLYLAAVLLPVVGVALWVWAAAWLSAPGIPGPAPYLIGLLVGTHIWPRAATVPAVAGAAGLLGVTAAVLVRVLRPRPSSSRVDHKAASLARPADLALLLPAGAHADAVRLGAVQASDGVPIGRLLPGRSFLRSTWEWTQVWLMGPRAGKTSCVCVRQVVETSGPVLATSNKRDLVDLTRGVRARLGTVWVFDPQDLSGEAPTWWWNPLSYVTGVPEAEEMAGLFAAATRDEGAELDAYFDSEAQNYLAGLLLAAASAGEPITQVLTWAAKPGDNTPANMLRIAGYHGMSETLRGIIELSDRQRDGVVGTARKAISWLGNPELLPWIVGEAGDRRPEFNPAQFVATRQTLYLLSREGRGTSRAITAALTVATVTAAERLAARSPRGRLAVPLMVVLDEAANIVKWPDLPDLYSHYGSRGIAIATFLQSWNQGVAVWGRDGMEKLWSAANARVVGAGLAQADHLQGVATLIGDHDVVHRDLSSSSQSSGWLSSNRSTSVRLHRERILEANELAALPRDRAVLLSSGAPPALIELVHWSQTDYADDVRASEAYYGATTAPLKPAVAR